MIDLQSIKREVANIGEEFFYKILCLNGRNDGDKKRTGVQIVVAQPHTRNMAVISIGEPSDVAKFLAVEKAVRSEFYKDATSQNSDNEDMMQYAGSLTFNDGDVNIQVSVSGLKPCEDVALSAIILSKILDKKISEITDVICDNKGMLPACFFDKDHYLYDLLSK